MAKLILAPEGLAYFDCPGCGQPHVLRVTGAEAWQWNGSVDAPTLRPSVLYQCGHYAPARAHPDVCWCTYNAEHPEEKAPFVCVLCHSFVTEGKIEFLTDSTHALAGQTVALPECE